MEKIINNSYRTKLKPEINSYKEGLKLAENYLKSGKFNEAFDVYEALLDLDNTDKFELLSIIYESFRSFPLQDRYNLYQSRVFNFGIKEGDKVLDIGSGNVPFPLATHLADITIEDNTYGRAGVPFKFLENKPVYEINIEDMPFEDNEFDFVYCSHVLEHVDNPEKACKELMRVGKRGYIETPSYHKDLIFNTAEVSNHKWKVSFSNNTLEFNNYENDELKGIGVDVFREMSLNPASDREKAFYSLIHLRPELFNTMLIWEEKFNVKVNNHLVKIESENKVDLNFIIIVLNGMPFIKYLLKSIYKYAKRIVVIEGAVENCKFAADENGNSIDGTIEAIREFNDHEDKLVFAQGVWEEKLHMQNKGLEFIDDGYVWLVDSDEFYKDTDIEKVIDLLSKDNSITQLNFISNFNFWKGFDYYFTSPEFFKPIHHYRRIFKYQKGSYFTSHRPPTLLYPQENRTTDEINLIDGFQTYSLGINLYHYSYVFKEQVEQKIKLYNKYGWGEGWNLDLINWYNNFYLAWTPENRELLEKEYPIWTGSKESFSVRFLGDHPLEINNLRKEIKIEDANITEEYMANCELNFNDRSLNIPDQFLVSEIIGDTKYQQKVLIAWSYIQTDAPIDKRKKWMRYNIQNNIPFWNIHVALTYTALKLKPENYLEVGVRIGGSMVQVLNAWIPPKITAVDIWSGEYASLPNTIEFTQKQLNKFLESTQKMTSIEYIHGDSHDVLKNLIAQGRKYKLITIDGDHTLEGAEEDLEDAVKLLDSSGAIVFDDITHPSHKYLLDLSIQFADKHNLQIVINTHQDNGCAIFLKNIDLWDFLKPEEEEKQVKKLKVAEEESKGEDLTEISENSTFSKVITEVITNYKPKKIIETGTYLGTGTTKIIASALKSLNINSTFYSIEVNPQNYANAKVNLTSANLIDKVNLLNGLSMPKELLPDKETLNKTTVTSVEFSDVFIDHPENERVDKYFNETNFPYLPDNLLDKCLLEFEYKPEFVILDSGGHIGFIEFNYVINKIKSDCILALDDIYHIKHHKSYLFIKQDNRFEIIHESKEKFGFCIAKFTPNDILSENENKTTESINVKEKIDCLVCGSKMSIPVRGNDIVQCISCGFVYLKERLTKSEMEKYYREVYAVDDPNAASPVRVPKSIEEIELKKEYKGALREALFDEAVKFYGNSIKAKKFIDIGCGWGGLLLNASRHGMDVMGFELTQPNVEFARKKLGFDVRQEQFDKSDLPENYADIITMSHVLEHVPEPAEFVEKIYKTLKKDGIFFCVVPNFNSLCSSIEKENWQWLERDWHYSHFTPKVLRKLLEDKGFTIEKLETVSGDYGTDAPIKALYSLYPDLNTPEKLTDALNKINNAGQGEEIRIIARKSTNGKKKGKNNNLLWLRTDSIGDAIISLNLLEKISNSLPNYQVTVVCQDHIKELYQNLPFVTNIISFNRKKFFGDSKYKKDFLSKLNEISYDLLINSVYSREFISEQIAKQCNAEIKIGMIGDHSNLTKELKSEADLIYTYLVDISESQNEPEKYKELLRYFNIGFEDYKARIILSKEDIIFADKYFEKHNLDPAKTIAFFAGAQFNIRYYYNFGKAIEESLKGKDYTVLALGGKTDEYINEINLNDFSGKVINATGLTSFNQSAALLAKCVLAVGSETSLAHAACALNVPNVILLGGGHFGRFMPYSELTTIISLPLDCYNCNWNCKYDEVYCIQKIDYKLISKAITNRLSGNETNKNAYLQKRYKFDWINEQPDIAASSLVLSNYHEFYPQIKTEDHSKFDEIFDRSNSDNSVIKVLENLYKLFNDDSRNFKDYLKLEEKLLSPSNNKVQALISFKEHNYFENYVKGLFELREGNLISAEKQIEEIVEYSPSNKRILLLLAEIYFQNRKYVKALNLLNYLRNENIYLDTKANELLKASLVVKEAKFINQLTDANNYEIAPKERNEKLDLKKSKEESISIIIPSKSRNKNLIETLESLIYAAINIKYDVILYMNEKVEFSKKEMDKYRISNIYYDADVFNGGKFSWTKLMNHGFKNSSGKWIMYGSDDIIFHPLAFNYAFQLNLTNNVGGINFLHRNTEEDYGGFYKLYGFDTLGYKPFINFGIIKREAYNKTDGFNEEIQFYAGDVDICWRIINKGYDIIPSYFSLIEHVNITDKNRSEKSDKVYRDDTQTLVKVWYEEIEKFAEKKIYKERFFIEDIYSIKKDIYLNSIENSISLESLKKIDNDYCEIELIENNKNHTENDISVSAIVSVFNSGKFIQGCLDDLLTQTLYKKGQLEIVLVNSGTDEKEDKIIKEYKSKFDNIVYIKLPYPVGIYQAWNIGIKASQGKYITNANTDDRHRADALEIMFNKLNSNSNLDLVYANSFRTMVANDYFNSSTTKTKIEWVDFDKELLLFGCFLGPHPMWKKELHTNYGYFNENLNVVGDYEFWLRISRAARIYHINEILGLYYYSEDSAEHRDNNITKNENFWVQKKYISKYLKTEDDIHQVLEKIKKLVNNNLDNAYFKTAFNLLRLRNEIISIEDEFLQVMRTAYKTKSAEPKKISAVLSKLINSKDRMIDNERFISMLRIFDLLLYSLSNNSKLEKYVLNRIEKQVPEFLFGSTVNNKKETLARNKSSNQNNFTQAFERSLILLEDKDYNEAVVELQKAIEFINEKDPVKYSAITEEELVNLTATTFFELGNIEQANKFFEKELQINPSSSRACFGLAETFYNAELYEQAKAMYEWAIKNGRNDEAAWNKLRLVNKQLNLDENNNSLDLVNVQELLQRAEEYINNDDFENALDLLDKILGTDENNIDALNDLSVIFILQNEIESALNVINKVIDLDSENEIAKNNLQVLENKIKASAVN